MTDTVKYHVKAPNGLEYYVNAPAGATDEQILQYVQRPWVFDHPATAEEQNAVQSIPGIGGILPTNTGTATIGTMLTGAGRTFNKLQAGGQQSDLAMQGMLKGALGMDTTPQTEALAKLDQVQSGNDLAYAPLRQQHPF